MNRLRLSTLSLTLAIAVMTLGYANPSFADKPVDGMHHGHGGGDDGGADGATFSVDIGDTDLGDLLQGGSGGDLWLQSFGGKNSIGLNDASGLDVGTLTGVGAFTSLNALCFPADFMPDDLVHESPSELHQAIIKQGKKGRAEASFWFHGKTFENEVRVLYVLKLLGKFVDDKGVPDDNVVFPGNATLLMDDWELKVENEGQAIKSISCIGELEEDESVSVAITVIKE